MKKKFIGSLLLASLTLASTSTFVSCKDYDDDINDVNKRVDDLAAMKTTLATVEQTVNDLSAQLEDAKARATAAVGEEQTRAKAAEAALAARLETLEAARTELQNLIDQKVDKSEYQAMVTDVYAKLEAVQTDLGKALTSISGLEEGLKNEEIARKAAIEDLQQQINALNKIGDPAQLVADLQALKDNIGTIKIADLKASLEEAQSKVSKAMAEIDVINVLVKTALRGLVYEPEAYYWGIEAQRILTLKYDAYNLPKTDYATSEVGQGHNRYAKTAKEKVLDFIATYHMNPSSADKSNFKKVEVISDDKAYTRSAEAGLYVKNWDAENGKLNVNIRMTDASKVKTVADNSMVTVFATQVTLGDTKSGDRDTTITSDYATLYKETVTGLVLCHKDVTSKTGVVNSHCGDCSLTGNLNHLMATAEEAGVTFKPQDVCVYNQTLDLRTLVETHYTTSTGEHKVFDPAKYGMEYKFELTGLYLGGNSTSESAHAAIADDGYTFRPQDPNEDGTQKAYGAEQDRNKLVGRSPMVRVSLVDSETGEVYDYGYIRIEIVDEATQPKADEYVEFTKDEVPSYSYFGECTLPGWTFKTTWGNTEYRLYSKVGCTREEFEANYTAVKDGSELKQYSYDGTHFNAATVKYGKVVELNDVSSENGTLTQVLEWTMTGSEALAYFKAAKANPSKDYSVAIKYESANKDKYPDVYVRFNTANYTIEYPSAKITWADGVKNPSYWYVANASTSGFDEIHNNVLSPEDNTSGAGNTMIQKLSKLFNNNDIKASEILTITDKTANHEYDASKLTLDLVFANANNGKQYKGHDGETYTLSVSSNRKDLIATHGGVSQTIATLSNETDVNDQKITYNPASTYACELLNYTSHNALNDDAIKAFVTVTAKNKCPMDLATDDAYFTVRFLRPINVENADATIEDANTTVKQTIKMHDLVKFTDWRDAWKNNYCAYYGITKIAIAGVANGQLISNNPNVKTDQKYDGNGQYTSLASVNSQVDFKFYDGGGNHDNAYLEYLNFGSTVHEFHVQIPVDVTYYWGTIRTTVTVKVKRTAGNAKPHNF